MDPDPDPGGPKTRGSGYDSDSRRWSYVSVSPWQWMWTSKTWWGRWPSARSFSANRNGRLSVRGWRNPTAGILLKFLHFCKQKRSHRMVRIRRIRIPGLRTSDQWIRIGIRLNFRLLSSVTKDANVFFFIFFSYNLLTGTLSSFLKI